MGSSTSFLYRVIATVEIISSGVITIFGVNTFILFSQMDTEFQKEKEMIYYSSIVSVVQSVLTILASIILIGCYVASVESKPQPLDMDIKEKRQALARQQNSLKRKAIAPTWLAWSFLSLASLLFVFIAPIHYCIQSKSDLEKMKIYSLKDGYYDGLCHSEAPELIPMRNSLRDLYSFSFIGILFKTLFILLVHKNWRKELRRGKKIMIYVQGCESSNNDNDQGYDSTSSPTDVKMERMATSSGGSTSTGAGGGTTTESGINENGGGAGDAPEIRIDKVK